MNLTQTNNDIQHNYFADNDKLINGIWPRSFVLWLTMIYLALFIIRPWEKLMPWLGEIHFERYYAITLILIVLISRRNPVKLSAQTVSVIIYTLAIGISAYNSYVKYLAYDVFYVFLTIAIIYFILISVIRSTYDLIFILISYIAINFVYMAKSQWEFWFYGSHYYTMGVIRLIGIEYTYGGPNILAMTIVVSLPIAYFLFRNKDIITEQWPNIYKKWFSPFIILYFLLAVSSVILTNSRTGMLGILAFILLVILRQRKLKTKIKYIFGVIIVLVITWQMLLPEEHKNRLETVWNPQAGPANAEASAEGRIEGFKAGIEMFNKHPISGVGVGNFIWYRTQYLDGIALNAHNLVGQILGEAGLIGGLGILLLVFVTWKTSRRVMKLSKNYTYDKRILVMASLALSIQNSIFLLLFEGLAGHNALRYNWLWLAAFSLLIMQFTNKRIEEINSTAYDFQN